MKYSKIKKLAKDKNISLKELADKINMTEGGFFQSFRNETLKVSALEKISDVLNVPINYFFDDEKDFDNSNNGLLKDKIKELQSELSEKNKYIKVLEEHIELLRDIREGRIK